MNFLELYKNNRKSVVDALTGLWCGEPINDSQRAYAKRIEEMIPSLFAPENAIPLVQCMNLYEPVHSVSREDAETLVGGLWDKPEKKSYAPYEHQYQAWHTLLEKKSPDGKPMSICVTTATGSGKTECFMMPLIHDLSKNVSTEESHHVRAIFLYPLNALMEDQKQRMEELLEGTGLTYTVYNGDLPERQPTKGMDPEEKEKLQKRIDKIRGIEYDENDEPIRDANGEIIVKYPHLIPTRDEVRKKRPDIILTNPTMLEYILLRKKDQSIIEPDLHTLKWIAIDETHSYTGAGAAELAMLLRRVLLAFDVKAEDVQFATSSATFGNADTIDDPEARKKAKAEEERKLKEFISGITGARTNQIAVIDGKRIGEDKLPENEDRAKWQLILDEDYVPLNKLFPEYHTIEEQLEALDEMCARLGESKDMKVKVHYFNRVPNNGLFVRFDQIQPDGTFALYSVNKTDEEEGGAPYIELSRCKNCGEYVSVVSRDNVTGQYSGLQADDTDIFDLGEETDDDTELRVVGLTNQEFKSPINAIYTVSGNCLENTQTGQIRPSSWHIIANTKCRCPYCNHKLTTVDLDDDDADLNIEEAGTLRKFRVGSDFISRLLAPTILDQLDKHEEDGVKRLHQGQQYLSFADSRQLAAKATLNQNLEQERLWVYTTIFHRLCQLAIEGDSSSADEIARLQAIIMSPTSSLNEKMEAMQQVSAIQQSSSKDYLTWLDVADVLFKSEYSDRYYYEFLKRGGENNELDEKGNIDPEEKKRYIQSIMTMYLTSRPRSAASPETMGLFRTYYPQLESINVPRPVVNTYNALMSNPDNHIGDQDWRDLLQMFIDYRVRSDQSVYLEMPDSNLDIHNTVRFADKKPHRKPAMKPKLERKPFNSSRIVRYLCALIHRDKPELSVEKIYEAYFDAIKIVVDELWKDLTNESNKLLHIGRHYDKEAARWMNDDDGCQRLNLNNISFKLYDEVWLCDVNSEYDDVANHAQCLRPISVNFKKFSPYLQARQAVTLDPERHEVWKPFPHYLGSSSPATRDEIKEWSKTNRSILWAEDGLWGEKGVFADRLLDIYEGPNLFIQAEHTAQVDKMISRQLQEDFKNHDINILACSTTMEMGVDLGTLQLVMLTSVPPQPANYKQRAGRSGRSPKMVKSVCITLCGSDSLGLRTLENPIESIIKRPVEVPTVDLQSPQVVQRHVNSFLIRWFGVFGSGSVNQSVLDYYTHFKLFGGQIKDPLDENKPQDPSTKLGSENDTLYKVFNEACEKEIANLSPALKNKLEQLLHNTVFEGKEIHVLATAKSENKRCYDELDKALEDVKCSFVKITGNTDRDKKYSKKLMMKYKNILTQRLLSFWATHRFTPNANMPVAVLSLDLNPANVGEKPWSKRMSANPSYSLREAIAQYAPGNSVVVDGVVYVVRGIESHNMFQDAKTYKKIARNTEETVMDDDIAALPDKKEWWTNTGRYEIELVQPVGFVPDINEEESRIINTNRFTMVNAQLIGATKWSDENGDMAAKLYDVRCNRDSGEAKILYYNEGIGYGYCLCSRCGRMVLEEDIAEDPNSIQDLPADFNPTWPKEIDPTTGIKVIDRSKPKYHMAINGRDVRKVCGASNKPGEIRRNIILGDLIQTDFAEIKIRHTGKNWINDRASDPNLLITLGVVMTQALSQVLGKDRNAVDFTILPFGHICIFDTNPGGAGYSNQLKTRPGLIEKTLKQVKSLLETASEKGSKDYLLDKFTLRFSKNIDIDGTLAWLNEAGI